MVKEFGNDSEKEMEKVYRRFKERQAQRRKVLVYSLSLLIIYVLLGIYIDFSATWFLTYWYLVGGLGFIVGFPYVMTRPWSQEMVEEKIFVYMYDARALLQHNEPLAKRLKEFAIILYVGHLKEQRFT